MSHTRNVIHQLPFAFSLLLLIASCHQEKPATVYFDQGKVSSKQYIDSLANKDVSAILKAADELPLQHDMDSATSIRLVIMPSFMNPYIIRLNRDDTTTHVTFKIVSKEPAQMGIDDLSLSFSGNSKGMDSLFAIVDRSIGDFDFYQLPDSLKNYTIADGTGFLLEYRHEGSYKVMYANRDDPQFLARREVLHIIAGMHAFIPPHLIVELEHARTEDDLLFIIFRKNATRE